MIDDMINIICDPRVLWKYAMDGTIRNIVTANEK